MKALHCYEHQNHLATLLARMVTREMYEEEKGDKEKFPIHMQGSLILQEMIHFQKPIKIVNSLLSMSSNEVATLFCDPRGSHVADSFAKAKGIGEKSRIAVMKHLAGDLATLAKSKHGSFTPVNANCLIITFSFRISRSRRVLGSRIDESEGNDPFSAGFSGIFSFLRQVIFSLK